MHEIKKITSGNAIQDLMDDMDKCLFDLELSGIFDYPIKFEFDTELKKIETDIYDWAREN